MDPLQNLAQEAARAGASIRPAPKNRRAALLLATALTGSLLLTPVLTTAPAQAFDITGVHSVIGPGAAGNGTLGNPYSYSSELEIGAVGTAGSVTVSAGGTVSATGSFDTTLGNDSGEVGTVTVTGTDSSWTTAGQLYVGFNGTGSLTVSDGGSLTAIRINIGAVSGVGSVDLSGGTISVTGSYAHVNRGNLTLSNGALFSVDSGAGDFSIGPSGSGNGALNFGAASGDTAVAAGTLDVDRISFGSGSGTIVFNHTDTDFTLAADIVNSGSVEVLAGTTILTGTNTYSGGTTISGGTLQIGDGGTSGSIADNIVNNSALIFNRSSASVYGGNLSGTGTLTKAGTGTLTLTGTSNHTGGTTISAGTLSVNGTIGSVAVNGGTLGGSGTVGTVIAKSGSTIAPGNSIGTLNVSGDTSFASGSTYSVEVDKDGTSDKIIATGTVAIDSGATVSISSENGTDNGTTYAASTTYTILTADTGVTGTFGSVSDNFAYLDAVLGYDANNVTMTLARNTTGLASVAQTANQHATATSVDSLGGGNGVFDAVLGLSAASARAAFDALSGEVHGTAAGLLLTESRFARNAIGNRIRGAFDGLGASQMPQIAFHGEGEAPSIGDGAIAWGQAFGGWGETASDGNAAQMERISGGFFLGADADAFDGWRMGLLAGYGHSGFDVDARASSGNADSYHLGAYAGRQFGSIGARLGTTVAWHDVSTTRNVTIGGFTDQLSADYSAVTAQIFGEIGTTLDTSYGRFEPFAGFALIHHGAEGFSESGGAAALTVSASRQTLGMTTLGARVERQFAVVGDLTASLTGTLGWRHAFGNTSADTTMRFATGNAFNISGSPIDRDTALIETGIKLDFGEDARLDVRYQGELGSNAQDHGFNANFSARF